MLYHVIFVFLCLTSLSMTISRSIHVTANGIISLFFMAKQYIDITYIIYNYIIYFYMLSVYTHTHKMDRYTPYLLYLFICDGLLSRLHVLAIVNSATMNIGVQVSF